MRSGNGDKQPKEKKQSVCCVCGSTDFVLSTQSKTCSPQCALIRRRMYSRERSERLTLEKRKAYKCCHCGKEYYREYGNKNRHCSEQCKMEMRREAKKNSPSYHASRLRRRKTFRNNRIETVNPSVVFQRSSYKCELCGKKINMKHKFPHPQSPTIDHIVPISLGGEHSYRNVRAAHMICNSNRRELTSDRGDQLYLF